MVASWCPDGAICLLRRIDRISPGAIARDVHMRESAVIMNITFFLLVPIGNAAVLAHN